MTQRVCIAIGAASAAISVLAGAFGAHALRDHVSTENLAVFETGARYQMFHALGMIAAGLLGSIQPRKLITAAAWMFLIGSIVFSGSLYILVLSDVRAWGAVTPFGGVAFVIGWGLLAAGALHNRSVKSQGGVAV